VVVCDSPADAPKKLSAMKTLLSLRLTNVLAFVTSAVPFLIVIFVLRRANHLGVEVRVTWLIAASMLTEQSHDYQPQQGRPCPNGSVCIFVGGLFGQLLSLRANHATGRHSQYLTCVRRERQGSLVLSTWHGAARSRKPCPCRRAPSPRQLQRDCEPLSRLSNRRCIVVPPPAHT